jgi:hypothetical protein
MLSDEGTMENGAGGGRFGDTPPASMRSNSKGNILLRAIRKVETLVGLLCAFFISLMIILMFIMMSLGDRISKTPDGNFRLTGLAWLLLMLVEAVFLCVVSDDWKRGCKPFALEFALRHRQWPLALRPLVGLWSAAHFLLGAILAFMVEMALASLPHAHSSIIQIAAFIIIGFTLANGFNLYAMFFLAGIGASERQIRLAWKWRTALDIAIAIAAAVCATKLKIQNF